MTTKITTPALWLGFAALTAGALAQAPAAPEAAPAAAPASRAPVNGIKFNFRGAPLETVLNYMSEAAGYVIVLESPVRGTIDMWSAQPVSKEEAVQLLNVALNKSGYSVTQRGRSLVVSSKEDAKKRNLPIRTGNDPAEIPETAEMVMQIIPMRRIDATQAARDLATLIPASATLTANQDSNSLVVTDTNLNLKHIVTLVNALDTSSDTVSTMRVFKLQNADPTEMAALLTNLFSSATPAAGAAAFGGGRGGFGGFPGFPGGNFGGFGGGNFGGRGGSNGGGSGRSSRSGNQSTQRSTPVVAIADPRTYSVIVTAAKDDMPGIAEIVSQLDSNAARKQKVYVYTLENADVRKVENVLKNLFQSNNVRSSTSTDPDPLSTRASSNSQATSSNITLGTSSRAGGR
jgi:type II secretory pathway component GspD/PulD (secretin)